MKQTALLIAGILALATGGFLIYKEYGPGMTTDEAVKIIENFAGRKFADPSAYENGFLIARAKAIQAGNAVFQYKDKAYSTRLSTAL